jgi:UDP-2-acetamido-2,6-beta-L-arabino-hexul-4-ose reductase
MVLSGRRILVTGARGFIGTNLIVRLQELRNFEVSTFLRGDDPTSLMEMISRVDVVVHLAGENRSKDIQAFTTVNLDLTSLIRSAIEKELTTSGRYVPLLLASSIQAENDTPYGRSKRAAEEQIIELAEKTGNPCAILRMPGVFGKWCKPNYNSVVATFCNNIARGLPIVINDPNKNLKLIYVDDVVETIIKLLDELSAGCHFVKVEPEYSITLGELAGYIHKFRDCRSSLMSLQVGSGLLRALYATYVSYIPKEEFVYDLKEHKDHRGVFVEMLKTIDTGQFSYFTSRPGVTRGSHYHHTKTEKFLVVRGEALFRFRHLLTNDLVELHTSSTKPQIVDTIPGWSHDITNTGTDEMVVLLWANENFNPQMSDTFARKI